MLLHSGNNCFTSSSSQIISNTPKKSINKIKSSTSKNVSMLSKSSNNNFESMRENQIVVPDIEKHINDTFDEFCEY